MEEVKAHPWFSDPNIANLEEIQSLFADRKKILDQENAAKAAEKEQARQARAG